eukprot:scaffold49582_cov75-Phaeocystis_antarctica.AAC.8
MGSVCTSGAHVSSESASSTAWSWSPSRASMCTVFCAIASEVASGPVARKMRSPPRARLVATSRSMFGASRSRRRCPEVHAATSGSLASVASVAIVHVAIVFAGETSF